MYLMQNRGDIRVNTSSVADFLYIDHAVKVAHRASGKAALTVTAL